MLKFYGFIGILMIIFVEANFILKTTPLLFLSFPIIWYGYILFIDALVYRIKGSSLVNNHFPEFLGMLIISGVFWLFFEFLNIPVQK